MLKYYLNIIYKFLIKATSDLLSINNFWVADHAFNADDER